MTLDDSTPTPIPPISARLTAMHPMQDWIVLDKRQWGRGSFHCASSCRCCTSAISACSSKNLAARRTFYFFKANGIAMAKSLVCKAGGCKKHEGETEEMQRAQFRWLLKPDG